MLIEYVKEIVPEIATVHVIEFCEGIKDISNCGAAHRREDREKIFSSREE